MAPPTRGGGIKPSTEKVQEKWLNHHISSAVDRRILLIYGMWVEGEELIQEA